MLLFRADATKELGTGHLVRSLALADTFDPEAVLFVLKDSEIARGLMKNKPYAVQYLKESLSLDEELLVLNEIITKNDIRAVVLDLLHYQENYIALIKKMVNKLVAFYEFNKFDSYSDLIVNYNAFSGYESYHKEKSGQVYCLGPEYIILRKCFQSQPLKSIVSEEVKRIVISMGGSDPGGITLKVIRALSNKLPDRELVFHLGPAFKHLEELSKLKEHLSFEIVQNVTELADLLSTADLAITAGGNTMYEACFLGIPTLVIAQNGHQGEFASVLAKKGAVKYLGLGVEVKAESILGMVEEVIQDFKQRELMVHIGRKIIDGRGAERINKKITALIGDKQ